LESRFDECGLASAGYTLSVNALIYLLAALFCGGFALRVWTGDRLEPVRRAFTVLGAVTALSFLGFALYLLPHLGFFRYLHTTAGAFMPVATLWFFERLFGEDNTVPSPAVRRLAWLTPLAVVLFLITDIALFRHVPRASPSEVILGLYVLGGFGFVLHRLWEEHERSSQRVERARLRYLLFLMGAAVLSTALEQLTRGVGPVPELSGLSGVHRTITLQGAIPPLGAVLGTLFVYFLYQVVQLFRLLDLHEIFARLFTLAAASVALVAIDGIAVIWAGFGAQPLHGVFQVFLATIIFLGFYEPLKGRIEAAAGEWFNRRGHRMELILDDIDHAMAKVISIDGLERELLGRLQGSGRAPLVTLYLWDQGRGTFRLSLRRGPSERPVMQAISPQPFLEGFVSGQRFYARADLDRRARRSGQDAEAAGARLRSLDAMNADLCLPVRSGDLVLGWLNLKHESWSDGFSSDEVRRLIVTVDHAAILLENLQSFERLKEQSRLAALGTMSAGLAHEIRNPLAGIKGAAQFLQGGATADEMAQFLEIIVSEVNRMDGVVGQFLAYARPFEIHPGPATLPELVHKVVELVRAVGLPDAVYIDVDEEDDLPEVQLDEDRIHQVLLNLLRNALQAVQDEGHIRVRTRRGRLRSGAMRGQEAVVIEVSDDGPGIDPDVQAQLFIPFFTTKSDGTGLGLAISRRLVEAHGGEITLHSRPQRGATFVVRLPVQQAPALLQPAAAR